MFFFKKKNKTAVHFFESVPCLYQILLQLKNIFWLSVSIMCSSLGATGVKALR